MYNMYVYLELKNASTSVTGLNLLFCQYSHVTNKDKNVLFVYHWLQGINFITFLVSFQNENTTQIGGLLHLTIDNVQIMFATNSIIQYCYLLPLVKVYFSAYW